MQGEIYMNCNEIKELCSDYLDCCLGDKQEVFELHLMQCPTCKREIEQLRRILATLRCMKEEEVPPDFIVRLNERIDREGRGFVDRIFSLSFPRNMNKIVAMAASIILVLLGTLFLANQNAPHENGAFVTASASQTAVQSPSRLGSSFNEEPIARKSSVDMSTLAPSQPPARTRYYDSPATPVAVRSATGGFTEVASPASALTPTKAPYVDAIIIIRATNPSAVTDNVRRVTQKANGNYLDYSENITFTQIPIQLAEPYLQALDSMGSLEIIPGPIDRGLPTALFQVIVLPSR